MGLTLIQNSILVAATAFVVALLTLYCGADATSSLIAAFISAVITINFLLIGLRSMTFFLLLALSIFALFNILAVYDLSEHPTNSVTGGTHRSMMFSALLVALTVVAVISLIAILIVEWYTKENLLH